VGVPFTVSGTANVFEGALTVDVLGNAVGLLSCTRHVQASSGTGTPGTWEGVIAFPPPDTASPITIRAYAFSAQDGSMEHLVERSVTVSDERPNIVITSPRCGDEVAAGSTFTVTGMAQILEAALSVDVRDASGAALLTQNVMAGSGVEFSLWTATFDLGALPAGTGFYDIVAYTHSPRDGSVIDEFPVPIVVRP
jgi:hypothetical protein